MLNRAYSILEIKSVDDEQRIIEGIATTPSADRVGDIVEPKGAQFKTPLPLLWQHDSRQPIGHVLSAKVTDAGILVKAQIVTIDEPGTLKNRVDEAWQSMKSGLVRGFSIGFQPLESADIEGTFGIRFIKWLWLELSAVTIPANAEATITSIKSFDAPFLAASGTEGTGVARPSAGDTAPVTKTSRKGAVPMKTIAEKKATFVAEKAAKVARMNDLMGEDDGVTLSPEKQTEFDTLTDEIKSCDAQLSRLETLDQVNKASAVAVAGATQLEGSQSRSTTTARVSVHDTMPKDLQFGAMVLCKVGSFLEFQKGNFVSAIDIAKRRYPSLTAIHESLEQKTAVAGGTTTDSNFASALFPPATVLESAFLEYLRPQTIIGKFGTGGIPSLLRVPFNVKIQSQTSGATASWVGEGKGKPVTKFNTTTTTLLQTKVAAISVITEELARFSRPGAEGVVRDELAKAVIERLDYDFIDPDKAVSAGVNPASITNGLTGLTTAGTSAANALTDLQALISPFVTNKYDVSKLVIIMPNSLAMVLSFMLNSLGQRAFPDIEIGGGRLAGLPVITSQYAGFGSSYGNVVIVASAENIALADDGVVSVAASREASIEMSDAPGQDATAGTGASVVSMFQTNSIALRAEREIGWKKLRSTAVTFMDDVNWGAVGSPY
jgi:HK97 family phage major capsid protein/HK97 family phage prohead protease